MKIQVPTCYKLIIKNKYPKMMENNGEHYHYIHKEL